MLPAHSRDRRALVTIVLALGVVAAGQAYAWSDVRHAARTAVATPSVPPVLRRVTVAPAPLPLPPRRVELAGAPGPGAVPPTTGGFPPPPASFAALRVPPGNAASVSLTFDDGPSTFTARMLGLLAAAHAPAVFCLIGQQAAALPALVRQEAAQGDVLCDHSRDHDLHMRRRGAAYEAAEVHDGLHDIQVAAPGVPVPFYRQPGGLWDAAVVDAAHGAGLDVLRWSDDPRDWSRPGAVAIAQRVLLRLQPGGVILLHDGGGDRTQTVQALGWLLAALPAAGWHFTLPAPVALTPAQAAAAQ